MSEAYFPEQPEPSGKASLRERLRHAPRAVVIAGLAATLAVGGAGVAFAAGSGTSSTSNPSGSSASPTVPGGSRTPSAHRTRGFGPGGLGPGGRGPGGQRLGGPGLGGLGFGGIVHGQVTVRSGTGYKTVDIQTGKVSKVDSTSITVASPDGYSHTYAVVKTTQVNSQSGGISSVSTNDQVIVTASVVNGTDTVTSIVDITKIQGSRRAFGFGPPPANGKAGSNGNAGSNGSTGTSRFGGGGAAPGQAL
jgi:hypothetical protein